MDEQFKFLTNLSDDVSEDLLFDMMADRGDHFMHQLLLEFGFAL